MTGLSIANLCVLAAALLPILAVGYAKAAGGRYDNADPRAVATGYQGKARRAYAAHQNGFEVFPFFAAAVIVAEMRGAGGVAVNGLALAFIGARVGYTLAYVNDVPSLRSILWTAGFAATVAIFLAPLYA
jgi:uncharacterized MAPEG superfamily protein